MNYADLAKLYNRLEGTTKKLEKRDIIADFLKDVPSGELEAFTLLIQGRAFPSWTETELGVAENLMVKTIAKTTGLSEGAIKKEITKHGDIGLAVESLLQKKKQTTLASSTLSVKKVYDNLTKIPTLSGTGSSGKKTALVADLLSSATPLEGKYLARTILEELRVGVGEGILRDAIALAFNIDVPLVEHAYNLRNDFGEVAQIAKKDGITGLEKITLTLGRPIKPMLAQKAESAQHGLKDMGGEAAFEIKYDGMRCQIHIQGKNITVFTRRLDDVTLQFPDVVEAVRAGVNANNAILEGEAVGVDPKTRRPQPFQKLSQRIKRKYDIAEMQKEVPVELNVFDLLYANGKSYLERPYADRWSTLQKIIKPSQTLHLADHHVMTNSKDAEAFLQRAVDQGHEGLMIKNLGAPYTPGSRVKHMYKLKPEKESLDLVVIGALTGEGRRSQWFGSFIVGARDSDSGEFLEVGKVATGLTDVELEHLTQILKPLVVEERINELTIKPQLVLEVGYEEIQRSPTYDSGYALRFPRVKRIRVDKGSEDADTLERIAKLYEEQ